MSTGSSPARRRLRGDDGETLVEILATVTVMGLAVVAILFALGAGIAFSVTHRSQASSTVALGAAAESVKGYTAPACGSATASYYAGALSAANLGTLPPGWSPSNLSIISPTGCNVASPGCGTGLDIQTVTIRAATPGSSSTQQVTVCKRSP